MPTVYRCAAAARIGRCGAVLATLIGLRCGEVAAADTFTQLKGREIYARFVGMELTDKAHWAKVFSRDGTYLSYWMLKKTTSKWRIEKNALCIDRDAPNGTDRCFEVWMFGQDVQLRQPDAHFPIEGVLQKPEKRGL